MDDLSKLIYLRAPFGSLSLKWSSLMITAMIFAIAVTYCGSDVFAFFYLSLTLKESFCYYAITIIALTLPTLPTLTSSSNRIFARK